MKLVLLSCIEDVSEMMLVVQWNHSFPAYAFLKMHITLNHLLYGYSKLNKTKFFGGINPFAIYYSILSGRDHPLSTIILFIVLILY